MPVPGHDIYIVDEALGGDAAAATDTLFLLSTEGPATATVARRADTGNAVLDSQLRAYFRDGGRSVYIAGYDAIVAGLPSLADAIAALPAGPGQVVAPEAVAAADLIALANGAWTRNKVALLQGPAGATDADLIALADAVIAGADGRGAALFADTGIHPGVAAGATETVPWTVTVAALIAKSDRLTRNPNLAAAGKRGVSQALGVSRLRTPAERTALDAEQVNTANVVNGSLRNYGFRSLANLTTLPHWWDFSGARTIMAYNARVNAEGEDLMFDQIDGEGIFLARYDGLLRSIAKELYDLQALHGRTPDDAYAIDTSATVNAPADLQLGDVVGQVKLKTSPYVNHLETNIVRRPITAALQEV